MTRQKQRVRPTPGDPWVVEQHWNTGAKENQQFNYISHSFLHPVVCFSHS